MGGIARLFGIGFVLFISTVGWLILGGITESRRTDQDGKLRGSVQSLWGQAQVQNAPQLTFEWTTERVATRTEREDGAIRTISEKVLDRHEQSVAMAATDIDVKLASDLRRKGLMWYSLYDVDFAGAWSYRHEHAEAGTLVVTFPFPDVGAIYDRFRFLVDGTDYGAALEEGGTVVRARIPIAPGQEVAIVGGYRSRGLDEWRYVPTAGVGHLRDFRLRMVTDFSDIDFPSQTLSPSKRARAGDGWALEWTFENIVAGVGIGMVTPQRVQPGELASQLAFSAPISLLFFVVVLYVLATLRAIDIHPMNYLFLAGAFFAFHLLFAYSVDHLSVETAFALASVVSVVLVVSYLRLVVSNRFAFVEAALAQLVYLVGFSLAHFWEGFTGLTVTCMAIATLFCVMQLTGRVRWSSVWATPSVQSPTPAISSPHGERPDLA